MPSDRETRTKGPKEADDGFLEQPGSRKCQVGSMKPPPRSPPRPQLNKGKKRAREDLRESSHNICPLDKDFAIPSIETQGTNLLTITDKHDATQQTAPRPRKFQAYSCQTCCLPVTSRRPYMSSCDHNPKLCIPCTKLYVRDGLEHNNHLLIKCPEKDCLQLLGWMDIGAFGGPDCINKHHAAVRSLRRRWCKQCMSYENNVPGPDPYCFTCTVCRHMTCVFHGGDWHYGEACTAHDARIRRENEAGPIILPSLRMNLDQLPHLDRSSAISSGSQ